jgi:hypothetical protein
MIEDDTGQPTAMLRAQRLKQSSLASGVSGADQRAERSAADEAQPYADARRRHVELISSRRIRFQRVAGAAPWSLPKASLSAWSRTSSAKRQPIHESAPGRSQKSARVASSKPDMFPAMADMK